MRVLGDIIPFGQQVVSFGDLIIAVATAEEDWTYARAWLRREWLRDEINSPG